MSKMSKIDFNKLQIYEGWNKFADEINRRISMDFNYIQLDVVKKVFAVARDNPTEQQESNEFENIHQPSQDILFLEWFNDLSQDEQDSLEEDYKKDLPQSEAFDSVEFMEYLQEEKSDEIQQHYDESENYPMWNTLFEARDEHLSNKIKEKADEIYNITKVGVMFGDDEGLLNNMLFMSSCGHSFLNDYWSSLYVEVFEWVRLEDYFTKTQLKKVGWYK